MDISVSRRNTLALIFFAIGATSGYAQEQRGSFGVPLQPFSTAAGPKRAEIVQVAYYSPRAKQPTAVRAEAVDEDAALPPTTLEMRGPRPMVQGSYAMLQNGIAYAPSHAPDSVKNAIWAVNNLRRKPYVWGGGHRSFDDYGYDCSGAVSYALHYAGALQAPLPSDNLMRYGERGRGRWITIYSRRGHTFAVIAGLRLDTTDLRYGGDVGPRWYVAGRETRGFEARHPVGL